MVADSHWKGSSYSTLILELTLQSPLADQTSSGIAAELGKNLGTLFEKRFAIICYRDDVKKE